MLLQDLQGFILNIKLQMIHKLVSQNLLPSHTPYFLIDKEKLKKRASFHKKIAEESKIKTIYSLKTFSHIEPLKEIAKYITGFSASSLFESKLAKQISHNKHTIHFVSPGIQYSQWHDISKLIHFMTFNSLGQLTRFQDDLCSQVSYGIRINPEISFIKDNRYNPCRRFSKLGVPLSDILEFLKNSQFKNKLTGLHFHNNCDSFDISEMKKTFNQIESSLGEYLKHFRWINLGGGYIYTQENISAFYKLIEYIKQRYDFEQIIIEPGSSFVKESVYLVSSVIDIFKRDGQNIAILDTTTNHLPEIFEYQFTPLISHPDTSGVYKYLLAGCSCLAGDLFGSHSFKNPLEIGSKIIFNEVGSYSLVKSHFFNGINLPDIYYLESNKNIRKIKTYLFEDYIRCCGG